MTDETERPEDTVRRLAMRLRRVEKLIDIEIERVEQTDDLRHAEWWEFRRKVWLRGVGTAHRVSARQLWHLKDACYEDGDS